MLRSAAIAAAIIDPVSRGILTTTQDMVQSVTHMKHIHFEPSQHTILKDTTRFSYHESQKYGKY